MTIRWKNYFEIILLSTLLIIGCKRELSYEGGTKTTFNIAQGTLQDSAGNCWHIIVSGQYVKDSMLNAGNYLTVAVNITATGKFSIYTDTVNGCWFSDTGTVTNTGVQNFILRGDGTPTGIFSTGFVIHFGNSVCNFTISPQAAIYNFDAPAGSCPNIQVRGNYLTGATLHADDSVILPVRVTVPGTYTIQTATINGMAFAAKGTFINAGHVNVRLTGTGTPIQEGISAIPVTINSTGCSFPVNVVLDTTMYWQFTAEGINYFEFIRDSFPLISPVTFAGSTNQLYSLGVVNFGINATDSYLNLGLGRINHAFTTGVYTPGPLSPNFKDFEGDFFFNKSASQYMLESDTSLNGFIVNVDTYNFASGLVEGAFSGPVYRVKSVYDFTNAPVVNITNGFFKAYISH